MKQTSETILIQKVKQGDERALQDLFNLYRPLVNALSQTYYLRYYDYSDWQQEAMIICYDAVLVYSPDKGSFGSLYKTKLYNHARTLIRYSQAQKRQGYNQAVSWDALDKQMVFEPRRNDLAIPVNTSYQDFIKKLSHLELVALLIILGEWDMEYVVKEMKIEKMKLIRARSRTLRKMREVLF